MGVVAIATLLSVLQRRGEFGLRRSVGAAPRHVAVLVLSEAGLTGTAGGLIGTSAGVLVISAVCRACIAKVVCVPGGIFGGGRSRRPH